MTSMTVSRRGTVPVDSPVVVSVVPTLPPSIPTLLLSLSTGPRTG